MKPYRLKRFYGFDCPCCGPPLAKPRGRLALFLEVLRDADVDDAHKGLAGLPPRGILVDGTEDERLALVNAGTGDECPVADLNDAQCLSPTARAIHDGDATP